MMSGVPLETSWAFNKRWNNKFYYKVASCWLFLLIDTLYPTEEIATIIETSSWSNKIINKQILLLITVLSKREMQYFLLIYFLHKRTNAFGLQNLF